MIRLKKVAVVTLLAGSLFLVFFTSAYGGMKIKLKNGKIVNVPVNKEDIVSITFEDGSVSSGGISWNFETGNLSGWTSKGSAFAFQPTYGDNPTARHRGQPSKHQGNYWIGGFEKRPRPSDPAGKTQGDGPKGTLTSDSFVIRHPNISFLIGGGCDMSTERVELLIDGQVVSMASGACTETMKRVVWNVSQFHGRSARIRLIDNSSGGWGHINFDDVKFY